MKKRKALERAAEVADITASIQDRPGLKEYSLTFRLTAELRNRLMAYAQADNRSVGQVVRIALEEYLKRKEPR